jgi:hypothetical protein
MSYNIDELKGLIREQGGLAVANQYKVLLPTLPNISISPQQLNILCKNAVLPGRQILTNERLVGALGEKMGYGYAVDDVSLTFHVTNKFDLKKYFDKWQELVFNPNTYELGFKLGTNGYGKTVEIQHLQKNSEITYSIILDDAFPTSVNAIELSNELDGLIELNVQLSYTNWRTK